MDVSYDEIKGSLGSLLFLWAAIEKEARDRVEHAHGGRLPKSAHGISAVLDAWEATVRSEQDTSLRASLASTLRVRLRRPLDIRNGVCHGLVGWRAARGDRPATLTWEMGGTRSSISYEELQDLFGWLSKVPGAMAIMSDNSAEGLGNRMADNPENRDWWKAEYGLDPGTAPS